MANTVLNSVKKSNTYKCRYLLSKDVSHVGEKSYANGTVVLSSGNSPGGYGMLVSFFIARFTEIIFGVA